MKNKFKKYIVGAVLVTSTIYFAVVFFYWTLVPHMQMQTLYKTLDKSFATGKNEYFTNATFVYSPWSYAQQLIRYDVVDLMLTQYKLGKVKTDHPIFSLAIQKLEEYVAREPNFPNYYFLLGRAYDKLSDLHDNNMDELKKGEEAYKKGLALNPYRQDGRYAYAINLMNQGREDESLKLIRETLEQNNAVAETYYYAGILELKSKKPDYDRVLADLEVALTGGINPDERLTKRAYEILFTIYYRTKNIPSFLKVINREKLLDPAQSETYSSIINYINENNRLPLIDLLAK